MNKAILIDLDGTLADVEHRVHHVQKKVKDWKSFNEGMNLDSLNLWCADLIRAMQEQGYEVILITGRSDNYRKQTIDWLELHKVSYKDLFMRAAGDHREDFEIKKEIYENEVERKYEVAFVVEDRTSVVHMWRNLGLVCLQCDVGDF